LGIFRSGYDIFLVIILIIKKGVCFIMNEITLNTGSMLTRRGAFQLKGLESTLRQLDKNGDGTISAEELKSVSFSSDAKTQVLLGTLSSGFEISTAKIKELEEKMEAAYKAQKQKKETTNINKPNKPKPNETMQKSSRGFFSRVKEIATKPVKVVSNYFKVKGKSKDDIKIEGLKSMLLLGALGLFAGPAGLFVGVASGIALTAGKMMAKDIIDPEPIRKPRITFHGEELRPAYEQAKRHDAARGNHFQEILKPIEDKETP
jgi:hypothetical protein